MNNFKQLTSLRFFNKNIRKYISLNYFYRFTRAGRLFHNSLSRLARSITCCSPLRNKFPQCSSCRRRKTAYLGEASLARNSYLRLSTLSGVSVVTISASAVSCSTCLDCSRLHQLLHHHPGLPLVTPVTCRQCDSVVIFCPIDIMSKHVDLAQILTF